MYSVVLLTIKENVTKFSRNGGIIKKIIHNREHNRLQWRNICANYLNGDQIVEIDKRLLTQKKNDAEVCLPRLIFENFRPLECELWIIKLNFEYKNKYIRFIIPASFHSSDSVGHGIKSEFIVDRMKGTPSIDRNHKIMQIRTRDEIA